MEMAHIALQTKTVRDYEKKRQFPLLKSFFLTGAEKTENLSKYDKKVLGFRSLKKWARFFFWFFWYNFCLHSCNMIFRLPTEESSGLLIIVHTLFFWLSRISFMKGQNLPRISSASLKFVVVPNPKIKTIGQQFGPNLNHSQPSRNFWNEGGGSCQCERAGFGYLLYELSDLEDIEFFWANLKLEIGVAFRPRIDAPFCPKVCNDLEMGEWGSS